MMIDATAIAKLVPHAGDMVLLDKVTAWDETRIACRATSHRNSANPLRRGDILPGMAAVEYAAQAMALHGGLTGTVSGRPPRGYLASLREVDCRAASLHDIEGDLTIEAEKLMGEGERVIYRFTVSCAGGVLAAGRAAVVLEA
jgi:predicted hotdog family 3-hydroxylacyl-ACP dehydratase